MSWGSDLWVGATVEGGQSGMFGTVGAVLPITGFVALAWSIIRETPERPAAPARRA